MRLLLANRLKGAYFVLILSPFLMTAQCEKTDDSVDLLTVEYVVAAVSNCSKPTAITLSPWNCASEESNQMVYDADSAMFLTGPTFSGHPNLECRLPGQTRAVTASRNSWFLSETTDPPPGYIPKFLFQHPSSNTPDPFTAYSSGDILICATGGAFAYSGKYQIITAN